MAAYTRDDLTYIETYIEAYTGDDSLAWEQEISQVPLSILRTIFTPEPEDDYELVHCYEIDEHQAAALNSFLDMPVVFDFAHYQYCLSRYGIYKD